MAIPTEAADDSLFSDEGNVYQLLRGP